MMTAGLDPDVLKAFIRDQPIIELRVLDPGYTGHGSDVWMVRTAAEDIIIRSSRLRGGTGAGVLVGA